MLIIRRAQEKVLEDAVLGAWVTRMTRFIATAEPITLTLIRNEKIAKAYWSLPNSTGLNG